jgi:hypothetical protein
MRTILKAEILMGSKSPYAKRSQERPVKTFSTINETGTGHEA